MKKMTNQEVTQKNEELKTMKPADILKWALEYSTRPVITTNFRPYEAAILYAVSNVSNDIPVIWCDTGYNTPETYRHAEVLIKQLNLNIALFTPRQTAAHRDVTLGIPNIDTPEHQLFTEQVKLEPFKRAMETFKPDVWFTNLRKGQTAHRDKLDILSLGNDGVLKVSPFYHYSDDALDTYLLEHNLPNEHRYYDPTKVLENRECGLHS